jgi:uncharacterized membrane protein YeaQ/YmgE (transglycosylase-associated protein family)
MDTLLQILNAIIWAVIGAVLILVAVRGIAKNDNSRKS